MSIGGKIVPKTTNYLRYDIYRLIVWDMIKFRYCIAICLVNLFSLSHPFRATYNL